MPSLDEKRENAVAAAQAMINLLERCGELEWAARIQPTLEALNANDLSKAITRYEEIQFADVGGFLDLVLSEENGHAVRDFDGDNQLLGDVRTALTRAIANIAVYLTHRGDHPLVVVPDAT